MKKITKKNIKKRAQTGLEVLIIFGILIIGAVIFGIFYFSSQKDSFDFSERLELVPEFTPDGNPISPDTEYACGDGTCNGDENSTGCCQDCGGCTSEPPACTGDDCIAGDLCSTITNPSLCTSESHCACEAVCIQNTTFWNNNCVAPDSCVNLSAPTFDPIGYPDYTYYNPINVGISFTDPGCPAADIYYTTDGSNPTDPTLTNVHHYTSGNPIHITSNTVVTARVFATNNSDEQVLGSLGDENYVFTTPPDNFCDASTHRGTGTPEDPKVICTPLDLHNVRYHLDWYYVLGKNIDLNHTTLSSESWYDSITGWEPIGTDANPFTGNINGDYQGGTYKIYNLFINTTGSNNLGLFDTTQTPAVLDNIRIENAIVGRANNYAGILVADNKGATIQNSYAVGLIYGQNKDIGGLIGRSANGNILTCYFNGYVHGQGTSTGGLIGRLDSGLVENSFVISNIADTNDPINTGITNITGNNFIGGLIGFVDSGTISKCYSKNGIISAQDHAGGLIGRIHENNSTGSSYQVNISNSYARNTVSGNNELGGLIGDIVRPSTVTITNSYAAGLINSSHNRIGGFIGDIGGSGVIIRNSFWDTEVSGLTTSSGTDNNQSHLLGLPTEQMKTQSNFSAWDFTTIWGITESDNSGYPRIGIVAPRNGFFTTRGVLLVNKSIAPSQELAHDLTYFGDILQVYRG